MKEDGCGKWKPPFASIYYSNFLRRNV